MINYKVCDPSGNITILVTTEVPNEKRIEVADELMKNEPTAQQVGYISEDSEGCDIELNMAGGEFCGNATLSTAALYKQSHTDVDTVHVKASGAKDVISVSISDAEGIYYATAKMPKPDDYYEKTLKYNNKDYRAFLVDFGEMVHLVMIDPLNKEDVEPAIKEWYKVFKRSALGIMSYEESISALTPAVLSNNGDFFCYESSCASGTTALAIYLAERDKSEIEKKINEPGGVLTISAKPGGEVVLSNTIRIKE